MRLPEDHGRYCRLAIDNSACQNALAILLPCSSKAGNPAHLGPKSDEDMQYFCGADQCWDEQRHAVGHSVLGATGRAYHVHARHPGRPQNGLSGTARDPFNCARCTRSTAMQSSLFTKAQAANVVT